MRFSLFFTVIFIFLISFASADTTSERLQASREASKEFMQKLKGTLQTTIKQGGPVQAIATCKTEAPAIARSLSKQKGWRIARTSLKPRNDANAPDNWELQVLKQFDKRQAKGDDPKQLEASATIEQDGQKIFRYMKAIPTAELCLTCHGEKLDPAITAKLKELYPNDKAIGYKQGEIRGAFSIIQVLNRND